MTTKKRKPIGFIVSGPSGPKGIGRAEDNEPGSPMVGILCYTGDVTLFATKPAARAAIRKTLKRGKEKGVFGWAWVGHIMPVYAE
ncbi:MAG: hypothetical protein ABFD96_21445 [Armatimonadia bacterium]